MGDKCAKIVLKNHLHILAALWFCAIMARTLRFVRWKRISSFFPQNGEWDLPSWDAIVRCIMETYLRLFSFCVDAVRSAGQLNITTGECIVFFKRLADIIYPYVALGVRDFKSSFPELPALLPRRILLGGFSALIVRWESLPGFDEIRSAAHEVENPDTSRELSP